MAFNNFRAKNFGLIACVVITHLGLLYFCQLSQNLPKPKHPPSKVIVSTIKLNPHITASIPVKELPKKQMVASQSETTPSSIVPTKQEIKPPKKEASKPLKQENPAPEKTVEAPKNKTPEKPKKPNPPKVVKKENPPAPKTEVKKTETAKIEPVKKPIASKEDSKTVAKKPSEPKKTEKTAAKPTATSQTVAAKKTEKPTPPAQPTWSKEEEALLKNVQQTISSIDFSHSKQSTISETPKQIAALNIEGSSYVQGQKNIMGMESSYKDELTRRLKILLRLPEVGEVKINLTIDREGKVVKVAILSSESEKNRLYVEKTLPSLTMPAFGDRFKDKTQYSFPVTLSNE